MVSTSRQLKELRPSGLVTPGCRSCPLFDRCGGMQNERGLLTCVDQFCCGKLNCDNVCPNNPRFAKQLYEIGGFGAHRLGPLQQQTLKLPSYVPMIYHGYRRQECIEAEAVSIDPYQILRIKQERYATVVKSEASLREHLMIGSGTKMVYRGTAKDRPLERYWERRRSDHAMDQIAKLNPSLYIGPNFSMFLDVPRHDNLYNQKRQLLCLSELSAAGVSVAPHLSATMPADWEFWRDYLLDNPDVEHVAFNFQTGYRQQVEGQKAIVLIDGLQEKLGRSLSLVMIGGAKYLRSASRVFDRLTLINSTPFMKAAHRQRFVLSRGGSLGWEQDKTELGRSIDHLMRDNIREYSNWVEERIAK